MQIIMLGTGHGKSLNCYNYCFLVKMHDTNLLVDSGSGNQIINQLKKINIEIEDIDNVFISHAHMDHILGLIWIIRFLCPKYYNGLVSKKLNIYGNYDVIEKLNSLIEIFIPRDFNNIIKEKFKFIKLVNNQSFEISNIKITAFDSKAKNIEELGFIMEYNNKRIIYLGDEKYNKLNEKYIINCDYAFMDARDINNETSSAHSTVEYSAKIAEKYHIKNLILSHCNDNDLENRKTLFKTAASKYYSGNIFVPNDLEKINIDEEFNV